MNRKVVIACDEQGQYTVGTEAPAMLADGAEVGMPPEAGAEPTAPAMDVQGGMKPAKDLDDALNQARTLLGAVQSTDGSPNPFQKGFAKVRPEGSPALGPSY